MYCIIIVEVLRAGPRARSCLVARVSWHVCASHMMQNSPLACAPDASADYYSTGSSPSWLAKYCLAITAYDIYRSRPFNTPFNILDIETIITIIVTHFFSIYGADLLRTRTARSVRTAHAHAPRALPYLRGG